MYQEIRNVWVTEFYLSGLSWASFNFGTESAVFYFILFFFRNWAPKGQYTRACTLQDSISMCSALNLDVGEGGYRR
jgi:hypothetical protein